jgi:hypothetical protein
VLPDGIHLSRDIEWSIESESSVPDGHNTLNSTYGEETGEDFILKLEKVNAVFGEYMVAFKYQVDAASPLNEWLLKGTDIQGGRE